MTTRQKRWISCLLSILIVGCAGVRSDRGTTAGPVPQFGVMMETTDEGVNLQAQSGTTWTTTGWSDARAEGWRFYVSRMGVAGAPESVGEDGFCFRVTETNRGVELASIRGTNWTSLAYSCETADTCRFLVTERGVFGQ